MKPETYWVILTKRGSAVLPPDTIRTYHEVLLWLEKYIQGSGASLESYPEQLLRNGEVIVKKNLASISAEYLQLGRKLSQAAWQEAQDLYPEPRSTGA